LPFALPAAVLAMSGGIIGWLARLRLGPWALPLLLFSAAGLGLLFKRFEPAARQPNPHSCSCGLRLPFSRPQSSGGILSQILFIFSAPMVEMNRRYARRLKREAGSH
jgi:hypothetical protein